MTELGRCARNVLFPTPGPPVTAFNGSMSCLGDGCRGVQSDAGQHVFLHLDAERRGRTLRQSAVRPILRNRVRKNDHQPISRAALDFGEDHFRTKVLRASPSGNGGTAAQESLRESLNISAERRTLRRSDVGQGEQGKLACSCHLRKK